ncbi:MAG: signal peptidase II [Planctomycetota bacterium]|jgi:signal peptidase II
MSTEVRPINTHYRHRLWTYIGLAIFGCGCDLWTKQAIFQTLGLPGERPPMWLIQDYVGFETAINQGALFGMGQGLGWLFGAMSILAIVAIIAWLFVFRAAHSQWLTFALGLVTGGILGNLYDRMNMPDLPKPFAGGVRDWILFRYGQYTWPNFNIADSLLVVGAIMLAIHSFGWNGSQPADAIEADRKSATP